MTTSIDQSSIAGNDTPITGFGTTATDPYKPKGDDSTAATPPPIQAPPPLSDKQPVQTPSTVLPGKGAALTTAASLLTGIMKGAMQGYDRAQQIKAQKLNALMRGLERNAQTAAQAAIDIAKEGKAFGPDGKPTKEFTDAANAADAADAMMWKAYSNAMGLNKPDKGKGAKKDQKQDQQNPLSVLGDKSAKPQDKLKALVQAHNAMGAAWRHQAAPFLSQDYRKQLELSRGEQSDASELRRLQTEDTSKMTTDQLKDHDQKLNALLVRTQGSAKEAGTLGEIEGWDRGLKAAGFDDEQRKAIIRSKLGGAGVRAQMHPIKVMDPNDPTKQIPAMQSSLPDEDGGYPVYDNAGKVIANPRVLAPSMLPSEHQGEMPVFNPTTNQFEQQATYSRTQKIAPSSAQSHSESGLTSNTGVNAGGSINANTPAHQPGTTGRHGIPSRQFNILQKQATAIDEARNSLMGDDPKQVGGLAADLSVFKSPESVKRLSDYIGLVSQTMDNESKQVAGAGPMAAAEWYLGIPQEVVDLQQGALRDASAGLDDGAPDGPEHKFVADYFRVMGTIGGLRASTGMSSSRWSFNTLRSELPTPGPVTSYEEAVRRLRNNLQETNVVSKRNPLSQSVDVNRVGSAKRNRNAAATAPDNASDEVYAADGKTLIGHIVDGKYVPLTKPKPQTTQ